MNVEDVVNLRLLQPEFQYPISVFKHPDALYYPSKKVVFLVTKTQSTNHQDDVFTEIAVWNPAEVKLLGTLALSVPEGHGLITYAPSDYIPLRHVPLTSDLSSDNVIEICLKNAINLQTEKESVDRKEYALRTIDRSSPDIEKEIFENIDIENGTLMRGLYTLIKSTLAMHSMYFMEEAFMNLQISREAALQIIRDRLQAQGISNQSYADVHDYIRSHFEMGESLAEYLQEQHEKWIETKHPMSIFGREWAPSLMADDVFETYECLVSVYRHIVLNEPGRSSLQTPAGSP